MKYLSNNIYCGPESESHSLFIFPVCEVADRDFIIWGLISFMCCSHNVLYDLIKHMKLLCVLRNEFILFFLGGGLLILNFLMKTPSLRVTTYLSL